MKTNTSESSFPCKLFDLIAHLAPSHFSFDNDSPQVRTKKERNKALAEARQLRSQLRDMLSKPLMMRGVSAKYLTGRNTVGLIDQLVGGTGTFPVDSLGSDLRSPLVLFVRTGHGQLLGLETSTALDDLAKPTQDPLEKRKQKKVKKFEAESKEAKAKKVQEEKEAEGV